MVCAPHAAAVEDGRAILAEGGNAIEAMLAMAASIAAVYPHMNHIGGDGFWLIREPSGRVRALMGAGRGWHQERRRASIAMPAMTKFRRAARSPRSLCRARSAAGRWPPKRRRHRAASCRLTCLLASAIKHARDGYTRHAQPGAADGRKTAGDGQGSRLHESFSARRQGAGRRRAAEANCACRDARASRSCRARRFLSRRRRPRDCGRSRADRQPGDARRSGKLSGDCR